MTAACMHKLMVRVQLRGKLHVDSFSSWSDSKLGLLSKLLTLCRISYYLGILHENVGESRGMLKWDS